MNTDYDSGNRGKILRLPCFIKKPHHIVVEIQKSIRKNEHGKLAQKLLKYRKVARDQSELYNAIWYNNSVLPFPNDFL